MTFRRRLVHRVLAGAGLALGAFAAMSGSATSAATSPPAVAPLELARWIRDAKPGLRIIDVRDAQAFEAFAIPGAERRALGELSREPWEAEVIAVVYADDEAAATQARATLRSAGVRNALVLRGGIAAWIHTIVSPVLPANPSPEAAAASRQIAEMSRWFGGVPRVGGPGSADADSLRASIAHIRRRGC